MGIFTFIVIQMTAVAIFLIFLKSVFKQEYTFGEMAVQFILTLFIISSTYILTRNYDLYDYMYINGKVTSKYSKVYTCSNYGSWSNFPDSSCSNEVTRQKSYSCTKTRHNGKRTVSYSGTCYKTQYKSVYPWEKSWFVASNVGSYTIARVNSQGSIEPPRYTEVNINDPVTSTTGYYNYVRAAKNSLFSSKIEEKFKPVKRNGVHDYYKINNVYTYGNTNISNDTIEKINYKLSQVNSNLTNYANLVIVFSEEDIMENLKSSWEGFEINDLVMLVIVKEDKIENVKTFSWSKTSIVNIEISDYFNISNPNSSIGYLDEDLVWNYIQNTVKNSYQKPKDTDFEYLKNDIHISAMAHILIILLNFCLSFGLAVLFVKNDFI